MATRTSWQGIADSMNELKANAWTKRAVVRYLRLCSTLGVKPSQTPALLPKCYQVTGDWVRNLFMKDAASRRGEIERELKRESGDDVLVLDWTRGVASRCDGHALLNAMDSGRRLLLSRLTATCGPWEAQPAIAELAARGVRPKAVYVDDECCGAWKELLGSTWPDAAVRLDGMHAIMRLTQTVTCTQHPWHGEFCSKLSEAIYTHDPKEAARLRNAWLRDGLGSSVPNRTRNKYVPRVIIDPPGILARVEATMAHYARRAHGEKGPLFTEATHRAWANLKSHVERGCLCDPPDLHLHDVRLRGMEIGGQLFFPVRTLRGASALEGFHAHQKAWLGPLAHHCKESGQALLAEGAARWNRKRRQEAGEEHALPTVFAEGLLHTADALHLELTGCRLYPALADVSHE